MSTIAQQRSHPVAAKRTAKLRRFFVWFALLVAVLVLTGFTRTFFIPLVRRTFNAPWFVYVHGGLFLTWIGLLITQAALIVRRRSRVHIRVGRVAFGLVPLMLCSGIAVAYWSSARDLSQGGGDSVVSTFGGELMDMLVFGVLATAALVLRRSPQAHKRLILLATLAVLGAAVGRIPVVGQAANYVTVALVVAIAVYDLVVQMRLNRTTVLGGLFLLVGIFSQGILTTTTLWLNLGRTLLSLIPYGDA